MAKSKVAIGKNLESDIMESIGAMDDTHMERYRDVIGYATSVSIGDFHAYKYPNKFIFEMKTNQGKTMSLSTRYKKYTVAKDNHKRNEFVLDSNGDKILLAYGRINKVQLDMMKKVSKIKGLYIGYFIEYREINECYYLSLEEMDLYVSNKDRTVKNLGLQFLRKYGLLINRERRNRRWYNDEMKLLLDQAKLDATPKEAYMRTRCHIDKNKTSIITRYRKIRNEMKFKKNNNYTHYNYDIDTLERIVEYHTQFRKLRDAQENDRVKKEVKDLRKQKLLGKSMSLDYEERQ